MENKLKLDIYCGDILDKMKLIDDESIDLIVTDPPYNLNKCIHGNEIYFVYLQFP